MLRRELCPAGNAAIDFVSGKNAINKLQKRQKSAGKFQALIDPYFKYPIH